MQKKSPDCFVLLLIFFLSTCMVQGQSPKYPKSKRISKVDQYHGFQIQDDFQWLEDTESQACKEWIKQQDQYLQSFISDKELYQQINDRIAELEKTGSNFSLPQLGGGYYFYNSWPPALRHAYLHVQKGLKGAPELLLDFNEVLKDPALSYNGFSVSPGGNFLAFIIKRDQSRWGELWLFDVKQKQFLKEKIPGTASAGIGWTADEKGFYYIRYGAEEELAKNQLNTSIHFHEIGKAVSTDQLVFHRKDNPNTLFGLAMSHDLRYAVIQVYQGRSDRNSVYLLDDAQGAKIIPLVEQDDFALNFIGSQEGSFFFYSNEGAPKGKVVSYGLGNKKGPRTLIPEANKVLAGGSTAGGNAMNFINSQFVLLYREGTQQEIRMYSEHGKLLHTLPLETGWMGSGLQGKASGEEAWFSLNTFLDPSTVFRIDLKTGTAQDFFKRELPIKKEEYVSKNTYYSSIDGTKVPIYIVHKKGLKLDGSHPVYMYAYGFSGWVAVPWYQPHLLAWLDMGGIYVLPGVRGGGEFGDAWREAGVRTNRQQAIDDYIAAAGYLIKEGYSSEGKIVANGWSASGSLAAAAVMQRPDLFGAALIGIPSLDLLRYTEFTPFKGWTSGYGSPAVKEEFLALYKWSPYHNIKIGTVYPPIMVTAGEKDQTTPPQHAYKFVAAMQQHQQEAEAPALLKIVWGGGHGFGLTSEQRRETYSQELYFLSKVLGMSSLSLVSP